MIVVARFITLKSLLLALAVLRAASRSIDVSYTPLLLSKSAGHGGRPRRPQSMPSTALAGKPHYNGHQQRLTALGFLLERGHRSLRGSPPAFQRAASARRTVSMGRSPILFMHSRHRHRRKQNPMHSTAGYEQMLSLGWCGREESRTSRHR